MDEEWFERIYASLQRKDTTYDGLYYTCVKTTKIFCRPSCRARTPYPQNVRFVSTVEEAIQAGYRPCKRCRPDLPGPKNPDERLAAEVTRLLESRLDRPVKLQDMAAELSVSPYHLQRLYKRVTGRTPAEHLQKLRLEEACRRLEAANGEQPIAEIARSVGFKSHSHFSSWFSQEIGLSPTDFRANCRNKASSSGERRSANE